MLKLGAILIAIWSVLNLLVALFVTVATVLGEAPPALKLVMTPDEIATVAPRALAVINAQAAIANPLIIAVCVFVLVLVWRSVMLGERWALPLLAGVLVPIQMFGFVSDRFLGERNLMANLISSLVLGAGLVMALLGQRQTASTAGR